MIIDCPSCKKKFKIDDSLIPSKGRKLQCGSCNYSWFYKIEIKSSEKIILTEDITNNTQNIFNENNDQEIKLQEPKINQTLKEEVNKNLGKTDEVNNEVNNIDSSQKSRNITFSKLLSYLIVSIISFIALVVLLDTLKTPLIDIFPGLEKVLFNLFETLKDIKLFIIDLS